MPPARVVLALYVLVFGLTLVGGSLLGSSLPGILTVEWLFVAGPVWLTARAFGRPLEVLHLARPRALALVGAGLVGASAWLVLTQVVLPLQDQIAPMPPELQRALEEATTPDAPLAVVLLVLAVTPAVCEELLCRGALLFGLAPRLHSMGAVLTSSALFAVLHLSPYRFLPTFLLGIAFGAMSVRCRSIVPGMLAHAINNGAIIVVGHPAGAQLRAALEKQPAAATVSAVVLLTIGLALTMRKG